MFKLRVCPTHSDSLSKSLKTTGNVDRCRLMKIVNDEECLIEM